MSKTDIWMPLYIRDYLGDTMRLTTAQHGAYLLLLMEYWQSGPLPDDDGALASIVKMPKSTWLREASKAVRAYFVTEGDGFLRNARADQEIKKRDDISVKRSGATAVREAKRDIKRGSNDTSSDPSCGGSNDLSNDTSNDGGLIADAPHARAALSRAGTRLTRASRAPDAHPREDGRSVDNNFRDLNAPEPHSSASNDGSNDTSPAYDARLTRDRAYHNHNHQEERTLASLAPPPASAEAQPPPVNSPREWLWGDGVTLLREMVGAPDGRVRSMLGKWLRDLRDDAGALAAILRAAEENRPVDPAAWLNAAVRGRVGEAASSNARPGSMSDNLIANGEALRKLREARVEATLQ